MAGDGVSTWSDRRLAVIAPDASSYSFITGNDIAANAPAWSPDGNLIAYVAAPDFGLDGRDQALALRRVWLTSPDGSTQRQLTFGENFRDASPMWSADGQYLLFARTSVEDFCDTSSYDLMRYAMKDGSVDVLVEDLPLLSTYNELVDVGEMPSCPTDFEGTLTDTLGGLNLGPVLDWWQSHED